LLTAERFPDGLYHLTRQGDHLVAIGGQSIEFFYDAGNTDGSPLQRRADLVYNIGAREFEAITNTGDSIYFLGGENVSNLGIYHIKDYQLERISNTHMDKWLNDAFHRGGYRAQMSVVHWMSHEFVFITCVNATTWAPLATYVFDVTTGNWGLWSTELDSRDDFHVVDACTQDRAAPGELLMIMGNGHTGRLNADGLSRDYHEADAGNGENITFSITTQNYSFGNTGNKFQDRLGLIGGVSVGGSAGVETVDVEWSDDHYDSWSTARTIDVSSRSDRRALTRGGMFTERAYRVSGTTDYRVALEGLDLNLGVSEYV